MLTFKTSKATNQMNISIIAAVDKNNLIGINGCLPWHYKEDLARFKDMTINNAVIMGHSTFKSIGSHPLKNRLNVVISRTYKPGLCSTGAVFAHSHQDAIKVCYENGYNDVFIIGGESVYREAMNYADKIYLTMINAEHYINETAKFFPKIGKNWNHVATEFGEFVKFRTYLKNV